MRINRPRLVAGMCAIAGATLFAQGRNVGNEWPTSLGDAQRTNWMRSDPNISVETLAKPGFELQWKAALEGQRGMKPAVQGVTVNGVTLFTPLSIITSPNGVITIDNDTGTTFWYKSLGAAPAATAGCAAAPVAATRMADLVQPLPAGPRAGGPAGGGRAGYSSAVGNPGEGVPIPAGGRGGRGAAPPAAGAPPAGAPPAGAPPPQPAPPAAGAPAGAGQGGRGVLPAPGAAPGAAPARGGGGGGFGRPSGVVYVISRDGLLHTVGLPSAKDIQKPAPLMPAGARATDPVAAGDMFYTSTTGKCGGTPDAVYAMDLSKDTKPVVSYKTTGSPVGALALTSDGTVVVVVTNGIVTLDAKTLAVKQSYSDANTTFVTGPLVFGQGGKDVIAAGTKDGRIVLIDAATLAAPASATKALTAPGATFGSDALAFWQEYTPGTPDPAAAVAAAQQAAAAAQGGGGRGAAAGPTVLMIPGQAWLLATTNNSVVAFKIAGAGGAPSLQPGWTSRTLSAPTTPVIVNNVVFAVSSGKPAAAAGAGTPAVLYALDGTTGKDLWNSGTTLKTFMPGRSLWTSNSQVYVGGNDGGVYAFGFALERK